MAKRARTTSQRGVEWAFNLGYDGKPEPEEVAASDILHRAYRAGQWHATREQQHAGQRTAPVVHDPNDVERETVYTITSDFPEFGIRTGDFLIVRPGALTPVCVRRSITPALAFALREHLRVCYEDEADPAPDLDAPTQTRHLALVK